MPVELHYFPRGLVYEESDMVKNMYNMILFILINVKYLNMYVYT